jgi:hypothetical protein
LCGCGNTGNYHRCGKSGHWAHDCRSKQPMKWRNKPIWPKRRNLHSFLLRLRLPTAVAVATQAKLGAAVRFGDGSIVQNEGRGTILYQCNTGEHRALSNVYFIPRLDTNIITVGQLDEDGHEVKIHRGVMQICEEDG